MSATPDKQPKTDAPVATAPEPGHDFYESENYKGDGCAHDVKR